MFVTAVSSIVHLLLLAFLLEEQSIRRTKPSLEVYSDDTPPVRAGHVKQTLFFFCNFVIFHLL